MYLGDGLEAGEGLTPWCGVVSSGDPLIISDPPGDGPDVPAEDLHLGMGLDVSVPLEIA